MTNLICIVILINVHSVIDKISVKPEFMISAEQEINGAAFTAVMQMELKNIKLTWYVV